LDLGLSNKGPIWQATKIPAQARLALCGGGHSLKHSNPKALLSSAGLWVEIAALAGAPPPPSLPLRPDIPKKIFEKKRKEKKKKEKK
jgi:hypothetical protein